MDRVLPFGINVGPSVPEPNEAPETEGQNSSEGSTSFPVIPVRSKILIEKRSYNNRTDIHM